MKFCSKTFPYMPCIYVLTEFCLKILEYLFEECISTETGWQYFHQIVESLNYLHGKGLIH